VRRALLLTEFLAACAPTTAEKGDAPSTHPSLIAPGNIVSGSTPVATPSGSPVPSPTPLPDGQYLESGHYVWTATAARNDTCWRAPKTNPSLPQSSSLQLVVGTSSIGVSSTQFGATQSSSWSVYDTSLAGTGSGLASFASNGIDCVLRIDSTFLGSITGPDVFDGVQHLDISESSGSQCGALVGTANAQLDQLPCSIDLDGSGTKS
jgi:hypothetical protein